LMTNAIKFTRIGTIFVLGKITPFSQDELLLTVSVSDQGIGMKQDEIDRVFDGVIDKRSALSQSLNPYGNGIGLCFCKEICENLNGTISADSTLGVGSKFTFTMTVKKAFGHIDARARAPNDECIDLDSP